MEFRSCSFAQFSLQSGRDHPLHLHADRGRWISSFQRETSPCIVSICNKEHANHSTRAKLFVMLHLDDFRSQQSSDPDRNRDVGAEVDVDAGRKEDRIVLHSTDEFHQHYGISRDATCLVVGPVPVFPLSKVLLSARTEETFEWANGKNFEIGLMVTSSLNKNLLVRLDDQFLAPPHPTFGEDPVNTLRHFRNLVAVECLPVKQGYISFNTELIVTAFDPKKEVDEEGIHDRSRLNEISKLKLITEELLSGITFENGLFDQQSDIICSQETADDLGLRDNDLVNVEIMSPDNVKDTAHLHQSSHIRDMDTNLQTEKEYLSMELPSSTVPVHCEVIQNKTIVCKLRVGKCVSEDASVLASPKMQNLEPFTFYISPMLWFNVGYNVDSNLEHLELKVENTEKDSLPPFATEIHLALVLSPSYSPKGQFDKTVIRYLSSTRIAKKGDVIMLNVEDNPNFLSECNSKDIWCSTLYYKIRSFGEKDESPNGFFRFDLKHTSLYQDGTINSFIPRSIEFSDVTNIPAGLCNSVSKLREILLPYVRMKMTNLSATVLVSGSFASGKWSVVSSVCRMLNLHVLQVDCYEMSGESSGATDAKITAAIQRASVYPPCALVLRSIDCIGRDRETGKADQRVCSGIRNAISSLKFDDLPIITIGITSNKKNLVAEIKSMFLHQIEIQAQTEEERYDMLNQLTSLMHSGRDVDTAWLAKHTVGFSYGEMWELLRRTNDEARIRIIKECAVGNQLSWSDSMHLCSAGITNQHCDFARALKQMQSQRADVIGVPKIPNVKWDDIGGLDQVKQDIKDTIQLPLDHPELAASGLRRSGILLYGPPGTGKTLLAKAVATQCSLSFLSVKGPELINMYVGQSEENVRDLFARAREAAPCVVFFDELDSLAPNRGRSGDSGGVMDRIVSQLLAELDGIVEEGSEKQTFVIGASNRPDLIDPALLRPGRFDKLIYVGINSSKVDQLKILQAQTRRCNLDADVEFEKVVDVCPSNMTGADFFALTSDAVMNALRRRISMEEERGKQEEGSGESQAPLIVSQQDLVRAAQSVKPSVSDRELERFKTMRAKLVSG